MASFSLDDISRRFGDLRAVDRVSATVPGGAFVALLGPSGCGKTTLLRLVAGLERPDEGALRIGDRLVAAPGVFVPPERRGLGMVFQSYALWPHMTVARNVAFGLNRLPRAERQARMAEALRTVGLADLAARRPHELSGGQRQRVALARSLAARPPILLLDEPLANLDAHLRRSMLAEFRRIHAEIGCTMVLVSHDQNEALAVADLVGVMDRGRIEQLASPRELFERPASPMVARFVGQGRTLPVMVEGRDAAGACRFMAGGRDFALPGTVDRGPGWLCLHARDLDIVAPGQGLDAHVADLRFEDGYQVADLLFDDLPQGDPLPLRTDRRLARGERLGVALSGGWILPRAGAVDPVPAFPARQPQAVAR